MTAEIAVMNKWAVALAADSKVTISGMRSSKAYDTVNKLFTLSKVHPVGVMIFGNAEFMDYPWETVIKMYRTQKGRTSEVSIVKWAEDFLTFLRKFGNINDSHKAKNIKNILCSWMGLLIEQSETFASSKGVAIGSEEYINLLKSFFDTKCDFLSITDAWLPVKRQESILSKHKVAIVEAISQILGSFKNDDLIKSAVKFSVAALFCNELSPQSSGIVIAGFGDSEYFPTVVEYQTDGYVGNTIKILPKEVSDISRGSRSCIRAFAQGDMVQRFMNGIDTTFHQTLMNSFSTTLLESCYATLDQYGSRQGDKTKARAEIKLAVDEAMKAISEDSDSYIDSNFSSPVVNMVALLPKDELAHLAESLVALTSLKRRVSSDAETVGGPIDVALISKGDGFVWIKRKHYFSPELNHQFARTYMDDILNGGDEDAEPSAASHRGSTSARPRGGSTKSRRNASDGQVKS